MQRPTCTGIRVRSPSDAHIIFHAVSLNLLPIVSRRLDTEERRAISTGCVYVWEERGPNAEATGLGIERWTDSIRWGPSRVRDEFLFYHEKEPEHPGDMEMGSDSDSTSPSFSHSSRNHSGYQRGNLVKQTYSVFVETPRGRRKWHLIAYFTPDTIDYLRTIDDIPQLVSLHVPPGKYKSARSAKGRPREQSSFDPFISPTGASYTPYSSQPRYAPYSLGGSPGALTSSRTSHSTWGDVPHVKAHSEITSHKDVEYLAPLTYLQNIPPRRRHPLDDKALSSFTCGPV